MKTLKSFLLSCLLAVGISFLSPADAQVTLSTNAGGQGDCGVVTTTCSLSSITFIGGLAIIQVANYQINGLTGGTAPVVSSITGGGTTWTNAVSAVVNPIADPGTTSLRTTAFYGTPTAATSTLTLTIASKTDSLQWQVINSSGAGTSIPQTTTATNTSTSATSLTMTLGALASGSASYGFVFVNEYNGSTWTVGSGYTVLTNIGNGGGTIRLSEYKSTGSTTVDFGTTPGGTYQNIAAAVALEIPKSTAVTPFIFSPVVIP